MRRASWFGKLLDSHDREAHPGCERRGVEPGHLNERFLILWNGETEIGAAAAPERGTRDRGVTENARRERVYQPGRGHGAHEVPAGLLEHGTRAGDVLVGHDGDGPVPQRSHRCDTGTGENVV